MNEMIVIDGSTGEGGGQILRSALALSMATKIPFTLEKIRAGRSRPGLLRQHLTCVRAAATFSDAAVTGDELGSTSLTFRPGDVTHADASFAIGSAGSTMLVLQTVLPPLLVTEGTSTLTLEGGTHNKAAPPFDHFERVFLATLRALGADVDATLDRHGFHPAGGGKVRLTVRGGRPLAHLDRTRAITPSLSARVIAVGLPSAVGAREADALARGLGIARRDVTVESVHSAGPGNVVMIEAGADGRTLEIVTAFGERGIGAEAVAEAAIAEAKTYVARGAPIGEHLADQLLLPLALGAGGEFLATCASQHLTTNAWVLSRFLGDVVTIDPATNGVARVTVKPRG